MFQFECWYTSSVGVIERLSSDRVFIVCVHFLYNMATTTAKAPSPLNLSDRLHQGENWKLFRREWKFFELAAGIHRKPKEVRVASLLNVVGKEGVDMYETFQWEDASQNRQSFGQV